MVQFMDFRLNVREISLGPQILTNSLSRVIDLRYFCYFLFFFGLRRCFHQIYSLWSWFLFHFFWNFINLWILIQKLGSGTILKKVCLALLVFLWDWWCPGSNNFFQFWRHFVLIWEFVEVRFLVMENRSWLIKEMSLARKI